MNAQPIEVASLELASGTHFLSSVGMIKEAMVLTDLEALRFNIRNVAMNAAFLAAEAGEPMRMIDLREAAKSEYAKLERPLTEAKRGG